MPLLEFIAAPFGLGAQIRDTQLGPQSFFNLFQHPHITISTTGEEALTLQGKATLPLVTAFCTRLAQATYNSITCGHFPCVIGGDHSIAAGTWSGIVQALNAQHQFGLIWLDAHMDSHIYETSPSKAYHGMPLAALLGYGDDSFTDITGIRGKLHPRHVVLVGIRSYEPEERSLLEKLGVRVFYIEEVLRRGLKIVLQEAIEIASQAAGGFGISLDLDFFDPQFAPGVGSPEPLGVNPKDFIDNLPLLKHQALKGFEIVELNPMRDTTHHTVQIAVDIASCLANIIK